MKNIYTSLLVLLISTTGLRAQIPKFFGVGTGVEQGGEYGGGCIFSSDTNGTNVLVLDSFLIQNEGHLIRNNLVEASNGKLYGTTVYSGKYKGGVLFEYTPSTNAYVVKYHFGITSASGRAPSSNLTIGTNGKIYGVTTGGGYSGYGTIFEYDVVLDTLITLKMFSWSDNRNPSVALVEGAAGTFYGLTQIGGGTASKGTIFKFEVSTSSFSSVNFTDSTGTGPVSLIKAANGKLYGLTQFGGGVANKGTLFEYDMVLDTIIRKVVFNGLNGSNPNNNCLLEATNGKLYGVTKGGGANNYGTLFEYNTVSDVFTVKKDFSYASWGDPINPNFGLVESSANKLLMSLSSGSFYRVYQYDIASNSLVKQASHTEGGSSRNSKFSGMIKASNGKFYGGAESGGASDRGYIFEFDNTLDTILLKVSLDTSENGKQPSGYFVKASNGKIYGTTTYGGVNNRGTIFEFNTITNSYTKKIDFVDSLGSYPMGNLIIGVNGKIYGTTISGGSRYRGILFEYDFSTNTVVKTAEFDGFSSGPKYITQASNGKIYGVAESANVSGVRGSLFEYDFTTDTLIQKVSFNTVKGDTPRGVLTQATNGKLYGVTIYGGNHGRGTLFEYDILLDSLKTLKHMKDSSGIYPGAGVLQASNGVLYGTTSAGRKDGQSHSGTAGVVYSYNITTGVYTSLVDFSKYTQGDGANGEFIQASNGKLYAKCDRNPGNIQGTGRIIEYDIVNDTLKTVSNLNFHAGIGMLLEMRPLVAGVKENKKVNSSFNVFPNPTSNSLTLDIEEVLNNVKIFDVTGKVIFETISGTKTINVSNFKAGMYIVYVSTERGVKTSRFIKN